MAPYGRLLLAPAEGLWPLATWMALRALLIPPPSPQVTVGGPQVSVKKT